MIKPCLGKLSWWRRFEWKRFSVMTLPAPHPSHMRHVSRGFRPCPTHLTHARPPQTTRKACQGSLVTLSAGYRKWIYFARSLKRRQNGRNHTTTWPSRPREAGQLGGHAVRSPWPAGLATAYALVCRRRSAYTYVTHRPNLSWATFVRTQVSVSYPLNP